jgi:hypothetical protein
MNTLCQLHHWQKSETHFFEKNWMKKANKVQNLLAGQKAATYQTLTRTARNSA